MDDKLLWITSKGTNHAESFAPGTPCKSCTEISVTSLVLSRAFLQDELQGLLEIKGTHRP